MKVFKIKVFSGFPSLTHHLWDLVGTKVRTTNLINCDRPTGDDYTRERDSFESIISQLPNLRQQLLIKCV
ncbi:hypothetical protein [Microcoleus sp. B4-D4]|uniref:hypothetical protein n=1 Tax=Microcoleus sp. B4-D4 TaxID=2818667 RepID=UPI002FD74F28